MANSSEYLVAILNSRLFTYMFSKTSSKISGGFHGVILRYDEKAREVVGLAIIGVGHRLEEYMSKRVNNG